MTHISASIGNENYITQLVSPFGINIISDEPVSNGGKSSGFTPHELLASSLASCTAITLRMYANRKKWEISEIKVDVFVTENVEENFTSFECVIHFPLNTTEEQRIRLLQIADKCPVHKILSGTIKINTELR